MSERSLTLHASGHLVKAYLPGPKRNRSRNVSAPSRTLTAVKGHIALAEQTFPTGTIGAQLDTLARMFLWQAGVDYAHGTGHGVGSFLAVHEGPQRIAKARGGQAGTDQELMAGMILSNEPGYYKSGAYGIRIENLVLVTEAETPRGGDRATLGFETLTLAPIDRRLIAKELLTPDEVRTFASRSVGMTCSTRGAVAYAHQWNERLTVFHDMGPASGAQ